jgi:serine/threonine protein phosphatase PrpC
MKSMNMTSDGGSKMQRLKMLSWQGKGRLPHQEDALSISEERGIAIVSDGFGGPHAGVEASRVVVDSVMAFLSREFGDPDATLPFVMRPDYSNAANILHNALVHANRELLRRFKSKGANERGGASVMAALVDQGFLAVASCGTTEAWLLRGRRLERLVASRSLQALLLPGVRLSRSLDFPVTALGLHPQFEPEIREFRLRPGDSVLLCTDGASPFIDAARERAIGEGGPDSEPDPQRVLDFIGESPLVDNAAVVAISS